MVTEKYTREQEKWIDENYHLYRFRGNEFMEKYNSLYNPPRTLRALQQKAQRQFSRHCRYTKPQDDFLKSHAFMDRDALATLFNETFDEVRTEVSITKRLRYIGATKWTFERYSDEENRWFRENYGKFSRKEIAPAFYRDFGGGRTAAAIRARYYREGR